MNPSESRYLYMMLLTLGTLLVMTGMVVAWGWLQERRYRRESDNKRDEREEKRLELEEKRLEAEESARYEARKQQEDILAGERAGTGSGGYIVMEMPEKDRPHFHDLLKGFEDYAKVKGYEISFSIDSSFEGRIAFKFTVKNDGVVVGPERVRKDFEEYVQKVREGDVEDLDDMPVVTTLAEHNLALTMLKSRIIFLQQRIKLTQNVNEYYEKLFMYVRTFPALPAPSVIVQTGGSMDSRKYNSVNSERLIQGDSNTYKDSSVNIGESFNERQERIAALDYVIGKLKSTDAKSESVEKAQRELTKVRDELTEYPEPNKSSIRKWLEYAKNSMTGAILGYETVEAAKKLWELFGI
jgi:hypothetical protein